MDEERSVYWLAARFVSPRLSWAWPSACLASSPVMEPSMFCAVQDTRVSCQHVDQQRDEARSYRANVILGHVSQSAGCSCVMCHMK